MGTHGCSDKQDCVGESSAGFLFLDFSFFRLSRFCARGRPLSYEGSDDAWSGGVIGVSRWPLSFCTILCACPLDVGNFCVFYALFRMPNVGPGHNDMILFVNCNYLCANLPSDLCLFGEDLHGPPPYITIVFICSMSNLLWCRTPSFLSP